MLIEGLVIIVVSLIIAYISISFAKAPSSGTGLTSLSVVNPNVAKSSWSNKPCTIRFAILVSSAPKTLTKTNCTSNIPAQTFEPNCDTYRYNRCSCNAGSCGNSTCAISADSYLSKLLWLGEYIQFYASGYTSENDKPYVPALLQIQTARDSTAAYMESVELPAIPLQKWTIVTIVKEGRRIDVFYGQKTVASTLLEFAPVPSKNNSSWSSGNTKWQGKIGLFNYYNSAYTSDDVNKDVSTLVNTRGIPYLESQPSFSFAVPEIPCMFGNCNKLPNVKPLNPFAVYTSSVS
jgi:hypothetical protein